MKDKRVVKTSPENQKPTPYELFKIENASQKKPQHQKSGHQKGTDEENE